MFIKVTDLILNKSCIQNTLELKLKTEKEFIDFLEKKKQEKILDYKILSN